MLGSLELQLVHEFPFLFRDYKGDVRTTCMCWGCGCDDGWYDLLHETCVELQKESKAENLDLYFTQIKEKFGGLRLYVYGGNENVYKIVDAAEKKSFTICEICGKSGELCSTVNWLKTMCNNCRKDTNYTPLKE